MTPKPRPALELDKNTVEGVKARSPFQLSSAVQCLERL